MLYIDKLYDVLKENGASVLTELNDGLNRPDILLCLRDYFYYIPEEIIELYNWRNGTKLNAESHTYADMYSGWVFLSIAESINNYLEICVREQIISTAYLPFFDRGGEFLLYDMNVESSPIYLYSIPIMFGNIVQIYDGLEKMIETVIECYRQECYAYNKHLPHDVLFEQLFVNEIRECSIAKTLNPASDYWKIIDKGRSR